MSLNNLAREIYSNNKEKGFWDEDRNVGELLMLTVSELGEALEAHRHGRRSQYHRLDVMHPDKDMKDTEYREVFKEDIKDTFEDELADTIIRVLDMCGGLSIDIDFHIEKKLEFNKTRERLHGKKY